jgi:hypothetical protein
VKGLFLFGLVLAGCASIEDRCWDRAAAKSFGEETQRTAYFEACVSRKRALVEAMGHMGDGLKKNSHCTTTGGSGIYSTNCN